MYGENPSTGNLLKTPSIIAYRQPPNLKHILIHSKVSNTTTTLQGNSKCDEKRCQICNLIDTDHVLHYRELHQLLNLDHFHATHLMLCT